MLERRRHLIVIAALTVAFASILAWADVSGSGEPADADTHRTAADVPTIPTISPPPEPESTPEPEPTETAEPVQPSDVSVTRTVTYTVDTRGDVKANLDEFMSQAADTLADGRSWRAAGIEFKQVDNGGDFTLWLSTASQLPSFGGVCHVNWSCRNGRNVIINEDRWMGASTGWNEAGGSIRDYRHMVVNHEVGHWLGLGHESCSGAGRKAAVMQQQSINLQGCEFNPWPLDHELAAVN